MTVFNDTGDEDVERVARALKPFAFEGVTIPRGLDPDCNWFTDAITGKSFTIQQVLDARAALAAMREGVDRGMAERFVAGHIRREETEDECWSGEIQTVGGHGVVADIYGASRDIVAERVAAVIRTLSEMEQPR